MKRTWKVGTKYGERYGYNLIDFIAYFSTYHKRAFSVITFILFEIFVAPDCNGGGREIKGG